MPTTQAAATHTAIYRRFRAQTFGQMVGQRAVVETLRNAVRMDRLSHGLLFVGPRGTGKTSTARILAKAVNCTDLRDGEPCDACISCTSIRDGRAMDVIELDAASNNRVDDMRELVPRVYTAASDLRRKVFIIDEVQRIKEGWDVLLKTLEEPPDGVLFIFCTTDPSQIRPAVVSRLQRFTFRPLTTEEIEGKLARILGSEGRVADADALALIAKLAAGGMRDAESLLDQVLATSDAVVDAQLVRDLLGLAPEAAIERFVDALAGGDTLAGIDVLDQLEGEGRDLVACSEQVISRLRERLVASMSDRDGAAATAYLAAAARRLTGIDASRSGLGGYRWQLELALLSTLSDGQAAARPQLLAPSSARDATPAVPTRAAPPSAAVPHDPRPARDEAPARPAPPVQPPERPVVSRAAPPGRSAPPNVPVSPPGADQLLEIQGRWPEIVAWIGRNPANKPLVANCSPVEVRDGIIILGFPENQPFLREKAEHRRSALEDGIAQVLGRPVGVRCVVANIELPMAGTEEDIDLVAQARKVFGGELADVADID